MKESDEGEILYYPIIEGNDSTRDRQIEDGDLLEVLPLRNMVLFPGVLMPVAVTRPKSQKLVNSAYTQEKLIAVLCQKDKAVQEPEKDDLYTLGTAARVLQTIELQNGTLMVILEGVERIRVEEFVIGKTTLKVRVNKFSEILPLKSDKHFIALVSNIKDTAVQILQNSEDAPVEAGMTLKGIDNPPTLVNYICVNFGMSIDNKQDLLECEAMVDRALKLIEMLNKELELLKMKADIQSKTKEDISKEQREYYLHRQMEMIQKELGDDGGHLVKEMRQKAEKKKWKAAIKKIFETELAKLERMSTQSPEYTLQENYLDTLLALPWNEYSTDNYDIQHAEEVLNNEHYGMDKVKERIVEYLAVLKQVSNNKVKDFKAPILCLYGPPGVGKTSLGKSVATALGRKYARISLGGLHDEAEIRGHRRTYIGAMPGRIIENIKKVGTSNPVFVLDEIDKVGADYKGDPTSALLEVLDPEQNNTFHDNYLDTDYDLSKVLFIATANSLDTIPRPLLDRMELIEMTGYMLEEKVQIAKKHLIPRQMQQHGMLKDTLEWSDEVITKIIEGYTRESGVRSLERKIGAVCRKVVTKISKEEAYNQVLSSRDVIEYLGQPRYTGEQLDQGNYFGVVVGLAWTQVGGEILFIEASLSPAKTSTLTLTGNLGDVMKESATLAMGYIKAHVDDFGISRKLVDTSAVHVHVPEGAIPKDGPSAGITITTALVSAFTKRRVNPRVAMTGEMTLRGKVLPIGGVKEKLLAAKRAGITDVVLCVENKKDVEEIPEMYLKGLKFHYVSNISEVIDIAIEK